MPRIRPASENGSTLIELLMGMAILLTVITAIVVGFVSATRAEADQSARVDSQQQARSALETMRRDIHCATVAGTSNSGATLTLTQPTGTPCATSSTAYTSIAWCTTGSSGRYQLRRQIATSGTATCSASSQQRADYISNPAVWAGSVPGCAASGRWPTVPIDILVNDKGTAQLAKAYELVDAIALRNAATVCP